MYATGPPDTPIAGDHVTAWASSDPNLESEWIEVTYARPIKAAGVRVYESFGTGALQRIDGFIAGGEREELWTGVDPTPIGAGIGVSRIDVVPSGPINGVRLTLATSKVDGWNEVDTVGLVDEYGEEHWPVGAISSSTFATHIIGASNQIGASFIKSGWVSFQSRGTQHADRRPPNWMNLNSPRRAYREGDRSHEFIMRFSTGWPLRSFAADYELSVHDASVQRISGGLPLSAALSPVLNIERALPLTPAWRGTLVNTLLYASLIWLLSFARRAVVYRKRSRRGCCPGCGYDLRGTSHLKCPECGRAVPKSA